MTRQDIALAAGAVAFAIVVQALMILQHHWGIS